MATRILPRDRGRNRKIYVGLAVAFALLVFAGFARTYFLNPWYAQRALSPLVQLHGLTFTAWIVLLVVQTTLVAANRVDIHRKLGIAGGVLAVAMVVVGILSTMHAARYGSPAFPPGVPPLVFLVVPVFDLMLFSGFGATALWFRRRSEIHKRLMILATIAVMPPAVGRLPFAFIVAAGPLAIFGLADLVLFTFVLLDVRSARRLQPATLWGGLAIVLSQPVRFAVAGTGLWMSFATWLGR